MRRKNGEHGHMGGLRKWKSSRYKFGFEVTAVVSEYPRFSDPTRAEETRISTQNDNLPVNLAEMDLRVLIIKFENFGLSSLLITSASASLSD